MEVVIESFYSRNLIDKKYRFEVKDGTTYLEILQFICNHPDGYDMFGKLYKKARRCIHFNGSIALHTKITEENVFYCSETAINDRLIFKVV